MNSDVQRVVRLLAQYWVNSPKAGDSLTGIAEFWLRREGVRSECVEAALEQMIQRGWVEKHGGNDAWCVYSASASHIAAMQAYLGKK